MGKVSFENPNFNVSVPAISCLGYLETVEKEADACGLMKLTKNCVSFAPQAIHLMR